MYAPADCGLFLQLERPANVNPSFRDVNAWKLLQLVLRAEIEPESGSTDWYDFLVANLAGESASAMHELFSERVALVAPTWTRLADGVILVQVTQRAALRHLIGPGMVESEKTEDGLSIYESTRGLLIATDGRTVILSQRQAPTEWFTRCVALLRNESRDSLQTAPQFSKMVKTLPTRRIPQGFLYFSTAAQVATTAPAIETTTAPATEMIPPAETESQTEPATATESGPAIFWPGMRAGVMGMYVGGNRLDFLLRASLAAPRRKDSPRVDMQRLKRLPRSTLVAWATSADVDAVFERFVSVPPDAVASYADFLTDALQPEQLQRDIVSKVGPRLVLVLGHDFVVEQGGSSLGLLIESTDADAVKRALDTAVNRLVDRVNSEHADEERDALRVTVEEFSGAEITIIELADYLASEPVTSLAVHLASTMRLSYTALDDWLLISWNTNHMRELIAARGGAQPVLGEFTDVARLRPLRGRTAVGLGQLATAAAVLGEWLNKAEEQLDSILYVYVRGPAGESGAHGRALGLGLAPQSRPGRTEVARVYEDGPCHGLVEVGDDVVAVDGKVLDLEGSNGGLRQYVRGLASGQTVVLRLDREGAFLDVKVVVDRPANPRVQIVADAVRALRRLQTLCRHLAFATFTVTRSDADSYHAHLRLRLSETR